MRNLSCHILFTYILLLLGFFCFSQGTSGQNSLEFDGIDDIGILFDSNSMIPPSDFTIEMWFKQRYLMPGQAEGVLISKYDATISSKSFIVIAEGDEMECIFYSGLNDSIVVGCKDLDTIAWKHTALSFSVNNMLRLYINGELVDSAQAQSPMTLSQVPIIIGNKNYSGTSQDYHFHGCVDELRVWNYELSKSDIVNGMSVCLTGNESGLIALYSMDSGSGSVLLDKTGNGFDGIINGPSWINYDLSCPFVRSNSPVCQGNALLLISDFIMGASYHWTGPNGYNSNIQSPIRYNSDPSMSGKYYLTVDTTGGSFIDSLYILVNSMHVFLGKDTLICPGDDFVLDAGPGYFYYEWNTGSTAQSIVINQPGSYSVMVHKYVENCYPCKRKDSINIGFSSPKLELGNDSVLCFGDTVIIDAGNSYVSYLWQDMSTTQSIQVNDSGLYWVEVSDTTGCVQKDSIYFYGAAYPVLDLPEDTILCPGESLFLDAGDTAYSYQWSNGAISDNIIADRQYCYHVTVTNISCKDSDSTVVDYHSLGDETDYWYFGAYSGIHFSGGTVSSLNNSAMNQTEGCASISDANGNLLFYTDGMTVWNRSNNPMPNGTGLLGSSDATNSALIVKKPGSLNIYYVFTLGNAFTTTGLNYSLIDMNADWSMGDVIQKNIPLLASASEKMTAVRHYNNRDVWLITHGMNNNNFCSYLVTDSSIITLPVVSAVGTVYNNWQYSVGCLKVSPDGSKLAVAYHFQIGGFCELFDFDNQSGIVSNAILLPDYKWPYGVEFSPDNTKLFISERMTSKIKQLDLTAGSPSAIVNSAVSIAKSISSPPFALQLGIDGKIYVAKLTEPYLGVINSPNETGMNSNYDDHGVSLGGSISKIGLPSFVQSYFYLPDFSYSDYCLGQSTQFSLHGAYDIDSVKWNFGDPASGNMNSSDVFNPVHYFDTAGMYYVDVKIYSKCKMDSITKLITIFQVPSFYLGNDTTILAGDSLVLDPGIIPNTSYYWLPTGDTSQSIIVKNPGYYILIITDTVSGCFDTDTIKVNVHNNDCLIEFDFNEWKQEEDTINGNWIISTAGDTAYQSYNNDITFLVSRQELINVKISGDVRVDSNWDDDYFGFVFGYKKPNDSTTYEDYEFLLLDWKKSTQVINTTPPAIGYEGLALVKVKGVIANSEIIDFFWSHKDDPRFNVIDTLYGSGYGWNNHVSYHFSIEYTSSHVLICIDNDTIFNVLGCFEPGKFGFYNYSQANVEYSNFVYSRKADFQFTNACFGDNNHFISVDSTCLYIPDQLVFWDWDFGDGGMSDKVNPTHQYQNSAQYLVSLKITDNIGCTDSISKEVSVFDLPVSQLVGDTNLCFGTPLVLDPGHGYISYLWQDSSTSQIYNAYDTGNYWVELTDTNYCSSTDTIIVNDVQCPVIDVFLDSLSVCPDTIIIAVRIEDMLNASAISLIMNYDNSVLDYIGYQNLNPLLVNGSYFLYGVGGTFGFSWINTSAINIADDTLVELIFNYSGNSSSLSWDTVVAGNCEFGDITGNILPAEFYNGYIEQKGPIPSIINQPADIQACENDTVLFDITAISDTLIQWQIWSQNSWMNLEDTARYSGSNTGDLAISDVTSSMNGYLYRCVIEGYCGPVVISDTVMLEVNPNPDVNLGSDTLFCQGDSINLIAGTAFASYLWSDGSSYNNIIVNAAGQYWVIVADSNSCIGSDTIEIQLYPLPIAYAGSDTVICYGDSLELTASGGVSFIWSTGSTLNPVNVLPTTTTLYTVTVSDVHSCSASDEVQVQVHPLPAVDIGQDTSICAGDTLIIDAGSSYVSYLWHDGGTASTAKAYHQGWYWVEVEDSNGCHNSDSLFLSLLPIPVVSLGADTTICTGDSISFSAGTGYSTYYWNTGSTSVSIKTDTSGTYWVMVSDSNGCSGYDSVILQLYPLPIAYAGSDTVICYGDSLELTASGGVSFIWSTGSSLNPVNVLPTTTTLYTVTVSDVHSCSASDEVQVQVHPLPAVDIGQDTSICAGDTLIIDAGSSYVSYLWHDGGTASTAKAYHQGWYWVEVEDSNGCHNSDSLFLSLLPIPVVSLGADTTICTGDSISFSAGTGYSTYYWNTGSTSVSIKTDTSGTYWVMVSDSNGCSGYDSVILQLYPLPIAYAGSDTVICLHDSVLISAYDTIGYSFLWNTGQSKPDINVSPANTTSYYLTVSDNNCSAYDTIVIAVNPLPSVFIGNDTTICAGDTIVLDAGSGYNSYLWIDGSTTQAIDVYSQGIYWVQVTNSYGCYGYDSAIVLVYPMPVLTVFPEDTAICDGRSVTLTVMGGTNYTWQPSSTLSSDTGYMVIASPTSTTTYVVTGSGNNTCSATEDLFIEILPDPEVYITSEDTLVCEGDSILLSANGASYYQWSPPQGLSHVTGDAVMASPPNSMRYYVNGTDEYGCSDTSSIFLNVFPIPYVDLGDDFYLCDGDIRKLRVYPYVESNRYLWQDGSTSEFYILSVPGSYWVRVSNSGCEGIDTVLVLECTDLWIPNAFSPDGDGLNDVFRPKTNTELLFYSMQIYTRWGALIFESEEISMGWDGSYKGKRCPVGVYVYKIKYKGFGPRFSSEGKTIFGYFTLVK